MDIFALTETEFFRQLTAGENENLHITYRDFIIQVFEMCRTNRNKGYAVSALLVVEIEISHLKTNAVKLIQKNKQNQWFDWLMIKYKLIN